MAGQYKPYSKTGTRKKMPKRIVMIVVILPDLLTNGVGLVFLARYAEIIKRTTRREFDSRAAYFSPARLVRNRAKQ